MGLELTQRQENFCLFYLEDGNAMSAYRRAYRAGRMSDAAIAVEASRLTHNPKVALRIGTLRAAAANAARVTLSSHLQDLQQLRLVAAREGKLSAAVSAEVARGKAAGLYSPKDTKDRTETTAVPPLSDDERMLTVTRLLVDGARRVRARDGKALLTELVRVAFDEERETLLRLVKEFLAQERARRTTS